MNSSFQISSALVLVMLCVLMTGNYFINRHQGIDSSDNLRETKLWGIGFVVYAVFDYLILML